MASLARVLQGARARGLGTASASQPIPGMGHDLWATVALGAIAVGYNSWWSRPEVAYRARAHQPEGPRGRRQAAPWSETTAAIGAGRQGRPPPARRAAPRRAALASWWPRTTLAVSASTRGTSGGPKGAVRTRTGIWRRSSSTRPDDTLAAAFGDPPTRGTAATWSPHRCSTSRACATWPSRLAAGSTAVVHEGSFRHQPAASAHRAGSRLGRGAQPWRTVWRGSLRGGLSCLRGFSLSSAPSSPQFRKGCGWPCRWPSAARPFRLPQPCGIANACE